MYHIYIYIYICITYAKYLSFIFKFYSSKLIASTNITTGSITH